MRALVLGHAVEIAGDGIVEGEAAPLLQQQRRRRR
jgi:hypothetical protein